MYVCIQMHGAGYLSELRKGQSFRTTKKRPSASALTADPALGQALLRATLGAERHAVPDGHKCQRDALVFQQLRVEIPYCHSRVVLNTGIRHSPLPGRPLTHCKAWKTQKVKQPSVGATFVLDAPGTSSTTWFDTPSADSLAVPGILLDKTLYLAGSLLYSNYRVQAGLRAPEDVVNGDDAAAPHQAQQLLKIARIAALVCICRPQRSFKASLAALP